MDQSLNIRFFKAFKQRLIHFASAQNLLVSIGGDTELETTGGFASESTSKNSPSSPNVPMLKIWDLNQWEEAVAPKCKQSFQLNLGRKVDVEKVTAIAISEDLNFLVVGKL
jgi:hypothetical protein